MEQEKTMDKKIIFYKIWKENDSVRVEEGKRERSWMENSISKYAYRCLPLTIANQHGWAFYLNKPVRAFWNGKRENDGIIFYENEDNAATALFLDGIITFHLNYLVRVPEGYNIFIGSAPNHFINGTQALTGIYEADWAPYSFTMNWKITQPNTEVKFGTDDPICFVFPLPRQLIEDFEVEMHTLDENPLLEKQYLQWSKSRDEFVAAGTGGWQKHYFQGKYADDKVCPFDHKTKISLKEMKNMIDENE